MVFSMALFKKRHGVFQRRDEGVCYPSFSFHVRRSFAPEADCVFFPDSITVFRMPRSLLFVLQVLRYVMCDLESKFCESGERRTNYDVENDAARPHCGEYFAYCVEQVKKSKADRLCSSDSPRRC